MKKNNTFRRAAALVAALSITVSLAAPAFADIYYIDDGDITITKDEHGQTVQQNGTTKDDSGEIIITTREQTITSLESDLEGPAAEDTGFGPVVEENYQQEDAEESEDDDQKNAEESENDEEQKDADRQENTDRKESDEAQKDADQPENTDRQENAGQQAAPAAAPAAPTSVNPKDNGFWGNTITVINKAATALKLTLRDVKIDVSDEDEKTALSVQGDGNVEIELDGDNELKSGFVRAGLEKNTSEGTLTLKDDKKDDNKKAGSLTATGGYNGAGIGGGYEKGTNNITITGGTVNAAGGLQAAGIGGGATGSGSNVTVSGAAQVTTIAGKSYGSYGAGATIGNGGNRTEAEYGFTCIDGKEIQADISGVTTGYIHHIIYEQDGTTIKREWWEPVRPQPNPEDPNAPTEESNEVDLGTPGLHVETLEGDLLPFDAQQQGGTLRVTTDNLAARLHGTRQALEALREQGVEQIQFVTTLKTTTLSVEDLLAEGGSWFALEHDGLVSRQLSAAQAESLKCWMH